MDDVDFGVETFAAENVRPDIVGFLVKIGRVVFGLVRRIDGGEEALGRNAPDFRNQLPAPIDGLLLEIVAKGPVAEHLEQRVMIGVVADVLEIVVLAAGADAFLRVRGAGVLGRMGPGPLRDIGGAIAEEDGHELIHPRVGEKQTG